MRQLLRVGLSLPLLIATGLAATDVTDMPSGTTDEVILQGGTTIYGEAIEDGDWLRIRLPHQTVSFERSRVVRINRRVRVERSLLTTPLGGHREEASPPLHPPPPHARPGISAEATAELALGLTLGTDLATDDVQVELGSGASADDTQRVGGLTTGLDLELLHTGGTAGGLWGAGFTIGRADTDRITALRLGLELRAGWRVATIGGWRLDTLAGAGVAWSRLEHDLLVDTGAGATSAVTVSGSGFGPILRIEARFGPALATGAYGWAVVGGVAWSSVDVHSDTTTATGTPISVDETLTGLQPYLGVRLRIGG